MISIVDLYAASTAGILVIVSIPFICRLAANYLPGIRFWFLRAALLKPRRERSSVTYIEFTLLGLYLAVNIACTFSDGTSDLMGRSGQMSSVNMVILMLGGRTNVLIDAFGIPLHTYYLVHHWIGRMAVAQAALHVGLATASRGWVDDTVTISGLVVCISRSLSGQR
jgi:hypothetical protein